MKRERQHSACGWLAAASAAGLMLVLGQTPVGSAAVFLVDDTGDEGDANPGDGEALTADGDVTLRAAVEEANALAGADTVGLPGSTPMFEFRVVVRSELYVSEDLVVDGDLGGVSASSVDQRYAGRVLAIAPGVRLTLRKLVIGQGKADQGGGILVGRSSQLVLDNCSIRLCEATGGGGGIFNDGGQVLLLESYVGLHEAAGSGGSDGQ